MMPAQPKRGFGFSGLFCISNPLFNDPNFHPAAFLAETLATNVAHYEGGSPDDAICHHHEGPFAVLGPVFLNNYIVVPFNSANESQYSSFQPVQDHLYKRHKNFTHTLILFRMLSRTKSIICDVSGHPDPNSDALDWEGLSFP
jgi:hypothetical protein